ncbi:MAG TPA: M20/M25/M40 family metallo-hydrolase [Vicinamibacteria bacterium]|nr:M20/M25/M40 family metallo-hydrolase [Vicinamibacteria bacterium]
MRWLAVCFCFLLAGVVFACAPPPESGPAETANQAESTRPSLGIRPAGDEEVQPDLSRLPDELKQVFEHIDENIEQHVVNLQRWIQQPSVSNSGEGIPESAQMVQGFFEQLGCQESRVYDIPMTEWGQPGNPVVYARCDYGAPRTLLIYWMYDTMPITQPDAWISPPFEARLMEYGPFKKVLIGRGATNSKGPQMVQWNAFMSVKEVTGTLPVNLIFVAEGDEERMSVGLRQFVRDHPELFADAEAMYRFGSQARSGGGELSGGSEGCVYIELTTSGEKWGRGPVASNIHGAFKRSVDSPAWRHIKMISTIVADDGNRVLVPGFYDGIEPLSQSEEDMLRERAEKVDMKVAAENIGVARFIADDPFEYLKMARYGISFNLDGIWGGNMYPAGAGAILPNKITSKHNMRYVPNQDGLDLVRKVRAHLDAQGYQDVELTVIGDVPWSKMRYDTDVARALMTTYDIFEISYGARASEPSILGPYWPAYLFVNDETTGISMPIVGGAAGHGGGAHAANEFWVIEGAGNVYGMAGAEKSVATFLYAFAGKLSSEPKEGTTGSGDE